MKFAAILRDLALRRILKAFLIGLAGALAAGPAHAQERVLRASEVELTVSVVKAQQPWAVLLWLPSEQGVQEGSGGSPES
ncbi:MAG: hypothetical protein P3W87_007205 [Gammaproteobacteria bacterium]|nr:hypothetical protein [Gammaproteobacteria bacterium]